jgi:hypothetical protein
MVYEIGYLQSYNLIPMVEGKEWKTTFYTQYGLFKSLLIPFGLINAPTTFQDYINNILAPYLDYFYTAYLDDMLIHSDNFEEYQQHIRLVLDTFTKVGLHLQPEKYELD